MTDSVPILERLLARRIYEASVGRALPEESWSEILTFHEQMAAEYGPKYLDGRSLSLDAFRYARIAAHIVRELSSAYVELELAEFSKAFRQVREEAEAKGAATIGLTDMPALPSVSARLTSENKPDGEVILNAATQELALIEMRHLYGRLDPPELRSRLAALRADIAALEERLNAK